MADRVEHTSSSASSSGSVRSYFGKYRGIVTDVDDPENRCRIRATVPAVLGEHPCGWAMPAVPFAGAGPWCGDAAGDRLRRVDRVRGRTTRQPDLVGRLVGERSAARAAGPERARHRVGERPHGDPRRRQRRSESRPRRWAGDQDDGAARSCSPVGACELDDQQHEISLNNGMVKVGLAGVSLASGAMTVGTPP